MKKSTFLIIIGIMVLLFTRCSSNTPNNSTVEQKPKELKKESIIPATFNFVCSDSKVGSLYCTLSDGENCEVILTGTVAFDSTTFYNFISKQLKPGQVIYLERTDNYEVNVLERNVWLRMPSVVNYDTGTLDESSAKDYLLQSLLVKNGISSVVNDRNNYNSILYDLETTAMQNKTGEYSTWNPNTLSRELKFRSKK